jgi:hypothetical protein
VARRTNERDPIWTDTDEVTAAQTAVTSAERLVQQTRAVADKAATRRQQSRRKASEAAAKARQRNTAAARRLAEEMHHKLKRAEMEHQRAIVQHKEARVLLSEQKELAKLIERKQSARGRAVAAFLKKWNREYDKRLALIRKNASLRRKWLQR